MFEHPAEPTAASESLWMGPVTPSLGWLKICARMARTGCISRGGGPYWVAETPVGNGCIRIDHLGIGGPADLEHHEAVARVGRTHEHPAKTRPPPPPPAAPPRPRCCRRPRRHPSSRHRLRQRPVGLHTHRRSERRPTRSPRGRIGRAVWPAPPSPPADCVPPPPPARALATTGKAFSDTAGLSRHVAGVPAVALGAQPLSAAAPAGDGDQRAGGRPDARRSPATASVPIALPDMRLGLRRVFHRSPRYCPPLACTDPGPRN